MKAALDRLRIDPQDRLWTRDFYPDRSRRGLSCPRRGSSTRCSSTCPPRARSIAVHRASFQRRHYFSFRLRSRNKNAPHDGSKPDCNSVTGSRRSVCTRACLHESRGNKLCRLLRPKQRWLSERLEHDEHHTQCRKSCKLGWGHLVIRELFDCPCEPRLRE